MILCYWKTFSVPSKKFEWFVLSGFKKALLQNPREMIRGRIFSEMIRIEARKSELQAESRSCGPKVGDTARQTPRIRTESPRKGPWMGFRCFYRNQSPPKGAGKLVPRENCRKVSKNILTLFDDFSRFLPCAKDVEKCRKYFWHFMTLFDTFSRFLTRPLSAGPFCGPLKKTPLKAFLNPAKVCTLFWLECSIFSTMQGPLGRFGVVIQGPFEQHCRRAKTGRFGSFGCCFAPPPWSKVALSRRFWTYPSFFCPFLFVLLGDFPDFSGIFPICSGMAGDFYYFLVLPAGEILAIPFYPDLLFLAFLENGKENHQKGTISYACRTPKILRKEGKHAQSRKEFLEKEKGKEIQKGKERRRLGLRGEILRAVLVSFGQYESIFPSFSVSFGRF